MESYQERTYRERNRIKKELIGRESLEKCPKHILCWARSSYSTGYEVNSICECEDSKYFIIMCRIYSIIRVGYQSYGSKSFGIVSLLFTYDDGVVIAEHIRIYRGSRNDNIWMQMH